MPRILVMGRQSPIRPPATIAVQLEVSAQGNFARAGWANRHTIPVSTEVAVQVLGANYKPCPYSGASPDTFFGSSPYRAFSVGDISDASLAESITGEKCDTCGYAATYSSHDTVKLQRGHPETMYLDVDQQQGLINTAAWDAAEGCLVPSSDDRQTLIIWRKSWSLRKERVHQLALKSNPGARLVADIDSYIILLQD